MLRIKCYKGGNILVLYSEKEINTFFSGIAADYMGCKLFINPYKEFTLENIKCKLYFKPSDHDLKKIIEEIIPNINYTYEALSNLVCITIEAGKINDIIEKKGSNTIEICKNLKFQLYIIDMNRRV